MSGAPVGVSSVAGGAGDDTVIGHVGRDNLHGQEGSGSLTGAGGNDDLEGDERNATLKGDAGDDDLEGGADADRLTGSTGTDILRGGDGNDSHFSREPTGTKAIGDTVTCGTETDFIDRPLALDDREPAGTPPIGFLQVADHRGISETVRAVGAGSFANRCACPIAAHPC